VIFDPLILSVETATLSGSVAISRGTEILVSKGGDSRISHSNTLLADIDGLLSHNHSQLADIGLFAVAIGPGSFTGLRIGIATVKALAANLDRPCAGVPTLYAIARAGGVSESTVAVLPAGRGEVFAQMFSVSNEAMINPLDEPVHISPQKLLERYGAVDNLIWCGEGAQIHRDLIKRRALELGRHFFDGRDNKLDDRAKRRWMLASPISNLAEQVANLANTRMQYNQLDTPITLRAIYVRPSDAELNF
jgi:tRNA threonylcarbamoyladenosine biosynthesis protein TsaB